MDFEAQIREAQAQEMRGWDWSWLNQRAREEPLPWDYRALALDYAREAKALLDVGTGGGEFFAGLFEGPGAPAVPPVAWATEGYPPNVILARERLGPLGIQVQDPAGLPDGRTGLPDALFDTIIDRHMGIPGIELARMLQPGGRYLTQQVGGLNCIEFNHFFGGEMPIYVDYTFEFAVRDLEAGGLRVVTAREHFPAWTFLDLAGVIFYLTTVPWQMPDFSVEKYQRKLRDLYEILSREGGFTVREHRILIEAVKD
jgi:SAM-dependent methyltransferase